MKNATDLLYTRAAAARIMNVSASKIVKFAVWDKVIFLQVKGHRCTFVSKKKFKLDFVESRQESGKNLEVDVNLFRPDQHLVYSKGNVYIVGKDMSCDCADFIAQSQAFGGRGCCKHGYAVLNYLGHNKLSDMIAA